MKSLNHLFRSVWFSYKHFPKKMYASGLIVSIGVVAVVVILLGVNGFVGKEQINQGTIYESKEDVELLERADSVATLVAEMDKEGQGPKLAKEVVQDKVLRTGGSKIEEPNVDLLSMRDYTALVRIVEAEATDEDLVGKILIANVVMNRVEVDGFPNGIYEVVHEKIGGRAQFSPIDDKRYYSVKVTDTTVEAVEAALRGVDYSEGALFFVAKSLASDRAGSWFDRNLEFVKKEGVHSFYKYY